MTFRDEVYGVLSEDLNILVEEFSRSEPEWKRGGVGAFMEVAHVWDQLDKRIDSLSWNIFRADITCLELIKLIRRKLILIQLTLEERIAERERGD